MKNNTCKNKNRKKFISLRDSIYDPKSADIPLDLKRDRTPLREINYQESQKYKRN